MQKTSRFLALASLFLVPVIPLVVANGFFFPFITGKAFLFRILIEIGFAAWLILCFYDAKYRPKMSPLFIGVSLFALVTLVADLLGVNPIRSMWSNFERMEGWITIIHLWAFFVMSVGLFGTGEEGRRWWHRWIRAELIAGLAVAIYGIFQLFGWAAIHQGSTRIDASLGNAAYMAVYMLWNAGLAFYMYLVERTRKPAGSAFWKWAYLVLSILFAYELFETGTRGTILGLIGGILLALFLYAVIGRKTASKKSVRGSIIAILAILAIMGMFLGVKDSKFVQNNEVLSRLASISWSEAQGQARNYIWPMAIKGFLDRPILGWGQENFNYIFNANYDSRMWNQEQWFDRAHSVFLDWLTASGLLGFAAYIALYVLILRAVWKSGLTLSEKSAFTGLVAGYAIHNVFVFDNLASYMMFFAGLAFAGSLSDGRPLWQRPLGRDAVAYVATPITLIALVLVVWAFNARPLQANTRLIAALQDCAAQSPSVEPWNSALDISTFVGRQEIHEQLLTCADNVINSDAISGQLKQEFFNFSVQSIADQISSTPFKDARTNTLAGSFMATISQFGYALPYLETANRLSPGKQSIDVLLATTYINLRHPEKAVALLSSDYEKTPENEDVKSTYALALIVSKNDKAALALYGGDESKLETINAAQAYTIAGNLDKAIAIYKKIVASDPGNINMGITLARLQYTNGDKWGAISTFKQLEKYHPEYKDQIEAAIRSAE